MSKKCVYAEVGKCHGDLFPTNVQDNVICDGHRRLFSSASWEYVEGLEKAVKLAEIFAIDGVVSYSLITKERLHELGEACFEALGRRPEDHDGLPW